MADHSKIINHPNAQEIINKLVNGISARDICVWLKITYDQKDQYHLRVTEKQLEEFMDAHVNLEATLNRDLAAVKADGLSDDAKLANAVTSSLKQNKTYQERLSTMAKEDLDLRQMFLENIHMMRARMEQVFDKIQENPHNTKPDYTLIKWFETLATWMEKYDKIVNQAPDQIIHHTHTVQQVDQYTAYFQEAIRETLAEVDPDMAFLFMDKLNGKLNKMKPIEDKKMPSRDMKHAQLNKLLDEIPAATASFVEDLEG